ncbi:MAG: adenosylmethionine decarboxylase [Myxococcota bacterium]
MFSSVVRSCLRSGTTTGGVTKVSVTGSHCVLELYECPPEILNDLDRISEALAEAAKVAKSTLLSQTAHRFEPQGVTALGLLAESHISVHTWPELGYAAADVFTCGEHCLPEAACKSLVAALQAGRHELTRIERGEAVRQPRPQRTPAPTAAATTDAASGNASAG